MATRRYTASMFDIGADDTPAILAAFDSYPRPKLLKEKHVAALLDLSQKTLRRLRQDLQPPVWIELPPGTFRYSVGALRDYIARLEQATLSTLEQRSRPDARVPDSGMRLFPEERVSLMESPIMRGGRRRTKHPSFSAFLAIGAHSDEWLFELVGPHDKPVDVLMAIELDLPDLNDSPCVWLTLREYIARLRLAVDQEHADRAVEILDSVLPPGNPYDRTIF